MSAPTATLQSPLILEHNHVVVKQIIDCIEAGKYCTLLGPRFSGKTVILRHVQEVLSHDPTKLCVYVNLEQVETSTQATFFASLAYNFTQQIADATEYQLPSSAGEITSSVFRHFLQDGINNLKQDLVFIIDHLEAVPHDLLRALLTSLRAAYMDWQLPEYHLVVVVASALSLAALTVGESSPFRGIATTVPTGDLTEHESEVLIKMQAELDGIEVLPNASTYLLHAAGSDAHLLREICQSCAQVLSKGSSRRLTYRVVQRTVRNFIQDEATRYQPLQEAIRLIEEDPDLLQCIVTLLGRGTVSKRELPLPLSSDLDALYLTGVVRNGSDDTYRLRNDIYRQFLAQYFDPHHVSHLLTMAGRWESAIDYLEVSIKAGNDENRVDLLETTINAMYACDDIKRATSFLARGLSVAFGTREAYIWLISTDKQMLTLTYWFGETADGTAPLRQEISVDEDCLEAQAYREAYLSRGQEGNKFKCALPLWVPGDKPLGVLTIDDQSDTDKRVEHQDHDIQLTNYLNQATRALQRLERIETLRDISTVIGRSLDIHTVLDQILDQMARVLPFDTASIQVLNASRTALNIIACKGFSEPASVKMLSFPLDKEDTYPNAKVWRLKKALYYAKAWSKFPHFTDPNYHATRVCGWLGIPLMVEDEAIGVITLDSFTPDIYTPEHENLAMLITGQAAIAIQRAQLYDREQQEKKLIKAIAQMTGSVHDLEQTWRLILEGAMRLTGAEAGNISLVDEASGKIFNLFKVGFPEGYPQTEHEIGGQSIQGWVAAQKRPALVFNVKTDASWSDIYYPGLPDTLAELAVPIVRSGSSELVGVINLESPHEGAFKEADRDLLEDLAVHADLAVHNAQQYKDLEKTKDYLFMSQTVAGIGLSGADWQHTIHQKTFSIGNDTNGLRQLLKRVNTPDNIIDEGFQALDRIEEVVKNIRYVPLTTQLDTNIPDMYTIIDDELPTMIRTWCGRHKHVTLDIDLKCPGLRVKIASDKLRMAMEKLINNALKAMSAGGRLTVTTQCESDIVHILIEDTGNGIPESARPYFLRKPVPRRKGASGTGTGALIARFIAHDHGGELDWNPNPSGQGTQLLMTLPVAIDESMKAFYSEGEQ